MYLSLTGGAGAGHAGGVAARGRGVHAGGLPLPVPLRRLPPGLPADPRTLPLLAAIEVTEGDPGVQDVVDGDLCRESGDKQQTVTNVPHTRNSPCVLTHRMVSLYTPQY